VLTDRAGVSSRTSDGGKVAVAKRHDFVIVKVCFYCAASLTVLFSCCPHLSSCHATFSACSDRFVSQSSGVPSDLPTVAVVKGKLFVVDVTSNPTPAKTAKAIHRTLSDSAKATRTSVRTGSGLCANKTQFKYRSKYLLRWSRLARGVYDKAFVTHKVAISGML
jgi:hypothetical protein